MLQLAIRDEHDALQAKIQKLAKNGRKPWREECANGEDFYSLLLKRNKAGLEKLIQKNMPALKALILVLKISCPILAHWKPNSAGSKALLCKLRVH